VREYRRIPTALTIEELPRVRAQLDPRDALIADWALSTCAPYGVLGLTVQDITTATLSETHRLLGNR
jgi:hypothetical protein